MPQKPPASARCTGSDRHEDGPAPQPRQDARDAGDRWMRFHRLQRRETAESEERQERQLHFPGEVCPTEDSEPPEVHTRLHRQRPARVPGETYAWCTMQTVGPPYSGKLNVRWDGKGMA